MKKNHLVADAGKPSAITNGGNSSRDSSPGEKPITSFGHGHVKTDPTSAKKVEGATGADGKGAGIGFKCSVTVVGGVTFKSIASVFGGQDGGGTHIGGPDGKDLTLILEGTIGFNISNGDNGDANGVIGGQDSGGPHIGEADIGDAAQRSGQASQEYGASQSSVASEGA